MSELYNKIINDSNAIENLSAQEKKSLFSEILFNLIFETITFEAGRKLIAILVDNGDVDKECFNALLPEHLIEDKECFNEAPLLIAMRQNNYKIIQYLVEQGADIDICDEKGNTPLFVALHQKAHELLILFLIENGANVNAYDNEGNTPLTVAVANSNSDEVSEVVKSLIEKGTDINAYNNAFDRKGKTALFIA